MPASLHTTISSSRTRRATEDRQVGADVQSTSPDAAGEGAPGDLPLPGVTSSRSCCRPPAPARTGEPRPGDQRTERTTRGTDHRYIEDRDPSTSHPPVGSPVNQYPVKTTIDGRIVRNLRLVTDEGGTTLWRWDPDRDAPAVLRSLGRDPERVGATQRWRVGDLIVEPQRGCGCSHPMSAFVPPPPRPS